MATSSSVSSVYAHVIDDVITKVRDEFISYGAGDAVLNELQALWEMRMMQCGAITGPIERAPRAATAAAAAGNPVHDLNVPYEVPLEEYATPTAEMLFPPTPAPQTPLPGTGDMGLYNIPTGTSDYAPSPASDGNALVDIKPGRPSPYMQPPSPWMNQRPLGVDVNVAYVEGRDEERRAATSQSQDFLMPTAKRRRDDYSSRPGSYMPQQDGSGDGTIEIYISQKVNADQGSSILTDSLNVLSSVKALPLPQRDGNHDDYSDIYHLENIPADGYNASRENVEFQNSTPPTVTPVQADDDEAGDGEPPLNEDDDDDEDLEELEQGDDDTNTQHLILAQFDKVTRAKNRWKCVLKDGIMHIRGRDILFNKANGEFDF